ALGEGHYAPHGSKQAAKQRTRHHLKRLEPFRECHAREVDAYAAQHVVKMLAAEHRAAEGPGELRTESLGKLSEIFECLLERRHVRTDRNYHIFSQDLSPFRHDREKCASAQPVHPA